MKTTKDIMSEFGLMCLANCKETISCVDCEKMVLAEKMVRETICIEFMHMLPNLVKVRHLDDGQCVSFFLKEDIEKVIDIIEDGEK